jgi:hypothetical protein
MDLAQGKLFSRPQTNDRDTGVIVRKLIDIVRDWQDGVILKPHHQREKVWPSTKDEQWIERLRQRRPKGEFLMYWIKDSDGCFLNDGLQRLLASLDYLEHPECYGNDSPEEARRLLSRWNVACDYDELDSHEDALNDFVYVNFGTELTPYEMCRGILVLMPRYIEKWSGKVEEMHTVVRASGNKVVTTWTNARPARHKHLRHDFSLFLRSAGQVTAMNMHTGINAKRITNPQVVIDGQTVENDLRCYLEEARRGEVKEEIDLFRQRIDRITGDIHHAMAQVGVTSITEQPYRWLLDIGLWRLNNQVDVPRWENFLVSFIKACRGRFPLEHSDGKKFTPRVGRLSDLKEICLIVGSDLNDGKRKRSYHTREALIGYHDHHPDPFVLSGDGPTQVSEMTKQFFPMGVVASCLYGRVLTHVPMDSSHGINALCDHLDAAPEDVRELILDQHPELDVDASSVENWDRFVHSLRARFGVQVYFEGGTSE